MAAAFLLLLLSDALGFVISVMWLLHAALLPGKVAITAAHEGGATSALSRCIILHWQRDRKDEVLHIKTLPVRVGMQVIFTRDRVFYSHLKALPIVHFTNRHA